MADIEPRNANVFLEGIFGNLNIPILVQLEKEKLIYTYKQSIRLNISISVVNQFHAVWFVSVATPFVKLQRH